LVLQWGAADRGLADALSRSGVDVTDDGVEEAFLAMLGDLLGAAQKAGSARGDLNVKDVKALLVGLQAMQAYNDEAAGRLTQVVLDGLRTP
jgi:hypothetical protein